MSDSDIIFRKIGKSDNKEIADVIRQVFREFNIDRPGTVYFDPTTDDLYALFQKPRCIYWIAEKRGKIIGGCGIYETPGLPTDCAELVKFYLLPEERGKGTGRMLMEKSFESAREFGYSQLYIESMPELRKAISLYEKAGFRFIPKQLGNSGHFGCDIWMIKDL